jgi:hypothetical protein
VSEAVMRSIPEVHRVLIGCPCGAQFSLPIDGQSYRSCRCWRTYEHGWRSDEDHERFLAIHDRETWEKLRSAE